MAAPMFGAFGNSRYAGGTPRDFATATFKVKTVTNLRNGVFVIKDTTDGEVQAAGAGATNVIGVMIRNLSKPEAKDDAAPVAGDEIEVALIGSGAWVWVRNGANLAAGALLNTSATGRAAAAATAAAGDFAKVVGKALIDHDGSGTEGDLLAVI